MEESLYCSISGNTEALNLTVASTEAPPAKASTAAPDEVLVPAHDGAVVVAHAHAPEPVALRLAQPRLRLFCIYSKRNTSDYL